MKQLSSRHSAAIRPKTDKTGEEGFALLDALIASALFGVFMMAVISMLVHTSHTNNLARDVTEASSLAAGVIERLASLPYEDLKTTLTEPDTEDGRFSFAIATSQNAVADNTTSITVTVSWVSQGLTRNVTLNDIRVDYI